MGRWGCRQTIRSHWTDGPACLLAPRFPQWSEPPGERQRPHRRARERSKCRFWPWYWLPGRRQLCCYPDLCQPWQPRNRALRRSQSLRLRRLGLESSRPLGTSPGPRVRHWRALPRWFPAWSRRWLPHSGYPLRSQGVPLPIPAGRASLRPVQFAPYPFLRHRCRRRGWAAGEPLQR